MNKVISGEKIGTDIPSRFLRRLQKTAGFGKKAVVGRAVIRQAFIRQMPASIRAHLATQPDSASLESLAMLATGHSLQRTTWTKVNRGLLKSK